MLYWLQQLQMKRWEFHNSPPAPSAAADAALAENGPALRLELGTQRVRLLPAHLGLLVTKPLLAYWEWWSGESSAKGAESQGCDSGSVRALL